MGKKGGGETRAGVCPLACQVFEHLRTVSADTEQEMCVHKEAQEPQTFTCALSDSTDTLTACAPVSVNRN